MKLHEEHQSLLATLATRAAEELLSAYRLVVVRDEGGRGSAEGILVCGIIGFNGDGIRGTCLLAATESPLRASSPFDTTPRDWIAELTNQLMGRVKNKLLGHGTEVYLSTPVVMRGEHLAPLPRATVEPIAFTTHDGGCVCIWIEIETAEHVVISPDSGRTTIDLAEGDALLF